MRTIFHPPFRHIYLDLACIAPLAGCGSGSSSSTGTTTTTLKPTLVSIALAPLAWVPRS